MGTGRMNRLDHSIRRLEAQRACLDLAASLIQDLPGPILELGLGNGRSYDHLRERLPERELFAFDRDLAAHPASIPDPAHRFLGELRETLPIARRRFPGTAALAHIDLGDSAPAAEAAAITRLLVEILPGLLRPGAVIAADRELAMASAVALDPPAGIEPGLTRLYRVLPGVRRESAPRP